MKYSIILADPPWQYADRGCNGAAEDHYSTMPLNEIKALPIQTITADDAVLFLWVTYPFLKEGLDLIDAWGFTYKSIGFNWIKTYEKSGKPFFGLGRWTRGNAEPCLLATRGKPKRIDQAVSQLIIEPVTRHSAKPAVVREYIVKLMGDLPRVKLFARESAPGWDCWGNQAPGSIYLTEQDLV